jgi:hypothetical protein
VRTYSYHQFLIFSALLGLSGLAQAAIDPSAFRPAPARPSAEAHVVVESTEAVENCPEGKLCVEGMLYNDGNKQADNVRLRVEFGGTKYTTPKTFVLIPCEASVMKPGDRQDFNIQMERRVAYKEKDKEKTIEVGKYNFKIVPVWNAPRKKPLPKKTPKKANPSKK